MTLGPYTPGDFSARLALTGQQLKVDELITHRLGLDGVKQGLDMTRAANASIKILIEMPW